MSKEEWERVADSLFILAVLFTGRKKDLPRNVYKKVTQCLDREIIRASKNAKRQK